MEAATEDSEYWGEWLTTPQGVAWSFKQQGLQLANPKTEGNLLTLTKLFNPLNVPSNALTAFAGTRLPRHGFFGIEPSYENVVKGKTTLGIWNLPVIGQRMVQLGYEFNNVTNVLTDRLAAGVELPGTPKAIQTLAWISGKALQIKDFVGSITGKNPILTVSGLGGPNSLFGIGSTIHYKSNSGVQLRDYLGKEAISSALDLNKSTYIGGEYGLNKYSFVSIYVNGAVPVSAVGLEKLMKAPLMFSAMQPGGVYRTTSGGFDSWKQAVSGYVVDRLGVDKYRGLKNPTDDLGLPKKGFINYKPRLEDRIKGDSPFGKEENTDFEPGSRSTGTTGGSLFSSEPKATDQSQYVDNEGKIESNILNAKEIELYNSLNYKELGERKSRIEGSSKNEDAQNVLKKNYQVVPDESRAGKGIKKDGDKFESFTKRWDALDTGDGDPINLDETFEAREDFVKLRFYKSIDTGGGTNNWNSIQFRGYVKGLSDKFNPSWDSINYVGRPDTNYIYKGVTRDVSFNFLVAASNADEVSNIWKKCNDLAGLVSPNINPYGTISGPVVGLQLGNYFENADGVVSKLVEGGTPGHISSLTFTVEDDFPWEIQNYEVPMYVNIDISFIVYGTEIPSNTAPYFWNK